MPGKGRKRSLGTIEQLRRILWGAIKRVEAIQKAHANDPEIVLKSSHALATVGGQYRSLVETSELAEEVERLKGIVEKGQTTRGIRS